MTRILSDQEFKKLLGCVIIGGEEDSIRPNSYILRVGSEGEFLNTGKQFELGKKKHGIKLQPGHSVALTAFETLDFKHETVEKLFPQCDLHGLLSPTTDLSREGIVAPTTQIDAGYKGTLNWTLTNTSSEERRFLFKERLYRLTIFLLLEGETPETLYEGDYQEQTGYVRSQRRGAPVGMKEAEWEDASIKGSPQDLLDNLIQSGYPWNILGQKLKQIDQQFVQVSEEYSRIDDALSRLTTDMRQLKEHQTDVPDAVRKIVRTEATALQNRWLLGAGSILVALLGVILTILSSEAAKKFLESYGAVIGLVLVVAGVLAVVLMSRKS
jgi:deoxycytidine triphosphate deaminase